MEEKEDWPPRFKVTPEGVAAAFLIAHCGGFQGKHAQNALVQQFKIFYDKGYEDGKKQTKQI